jgi:hypothetical protein
MVKTKQRKREETAVKQNIWRHEWVVNRRNNEKSQSYCFLLYSVWAEQGVMRSGTTQREQD